MRKEIQNYLDIKKLPHLTPNELKAAKEEVKKYQGHWLIDNLINAADTVDQPQTARAKHVISKVMSFLFSSSRDGRNDAVLDDWVDDAVFILSALEDVIDEWELIENARPGSESQLKKQQTF